MQHPLYATWHNMKRRCLDPADRRFERYGGRGIGICGRWLVFANFVADMAPKPSRKHTVERIDNDADYSPENCRWATYKEQANNRSNSIRVTVDGVAYGVPELALKIGVPEKTIRLRLARGSPDEVAAYPGSLMPSRNKSAKNQAYWSRRKDATQCVHGHELSPENTYITPGSGKRVCKTCRRATDARRNARDALNGKDRRPSARA